MEKVINIFKYSDYRAFLRDLYDLKKEGSSSFSHRYLAGKLGLSTPNFLLLCMQGKRNMSSDLCLRIAELFKFSVAETDYFEAMVLFSQAKNSKEKDRYFNRMRALRQKAKVPLLEEAQYDYLTDWYNVIIRELVTEHGFSGSMRSLAKKVVPPVSESQAKKSVDLLLKLGLIKKKGKGFVQSSPVVSTGDEVSSLAAINFHKRMIALALESIDRFKRDERNISSCTLNVSDEGIERIKKKLSDFRKEVLSIAEQDDKSDRVCQLNFQLFPVSKVNNNRRE